MSTIKKHYSARIKLGLLVCVTCLFVVEGRSLLSTKHVALRSSYKIKESHNINTHSKQQNQASQTIQFASLVIQRILLFIYFKIIGIEGTAWGKACKIWFWDIEWQDQNLRKIIGSSKIELIDWFHMNHMCIGVEYLNNTIAKGKSYRVNISQVTQITQLSFV